MRARRIEGGGGNLTQARVFCMIPSPTKKTSILKREGNTKRY